MGYGTNGLSFNTLRNANCTRLPLFKDKQGRLSHVQVKGKPPGFDWTPERWYMATNGELGELGNLLKKVVRGDFEHTLEETIEARDTNMFTLEDKASWLKEKIADELADTVIYIDLLAHRLNINLGAAIIAKFNKTSKKVGANVGIKADDWFYFKEETDAE